MARSIGQQDHLVIAIINTIVEAAWLTVLLWGLPGLDDVVHQAGISH